LTQGPPAPGPPPYGPPPSSPPPSSPPPSSLPPSVSPPGRTSPLAVASLVLSLSGLVILPFVGGLVGAALGVAALAQIRKTPGVQGRGVALAGTVAGLVLGVLPLAVFAALERPHWGTVPFALIAAYGGAIGALLWRETSGAQRLAAGAGLLGGVGLIVVGAVLAYFVGVLFIDGIKALVRFVFHQVGCSVRDSVGNRGKNCPAPSQRRGP